MSDRPEPLSAGTFSAGTLSAGAFEGAVHVFPMRVYWEDTDASGIVYHASYLRFAERARTEMLRLAGTDQGRLLAETGIAFAVRRCEIDYRAPARLDDRLDIRSRVTALAGASLRMAQSVERAGRPLADLRLQLACLDRQGRAARLPTAVRAAFTPAATTDLASQD